MIFESNGSLGDHVMLIPAIAGIKEKYPDEIIRTHRLKYPELFSTNPYANVGTKNELGTVRFDIGAYWNTPLPIGKLNGPWFRKHFTEVLEWAFDIEIKDREPHLWLTDEDRESVPSLFPKGRIIAIDTYASWPSRRWPAERFIELVRRLRDHGLVVEVGKTQKYVDPPPVGATWDFKDRLNVRQTAALLEQCVLYIGNDSGAFHLAAAVGTPQVVIFGVVPPDARAHATTIPVYDQTPCSKDCERVCARGRHGCIMNVSVDQVYEAVKGAVKWLS